MKIKKIASIISLGDPALRKVSDEIKVKDIPSKETKKLIKDLSDALHNEHDGIGISAPQIAVNKRLFVVCHRLFTGTEKEKVEAKDLVFINPKIIKSSKKTVVMEEGCLSIRGVYGDVKRPSNITLEAYNEAGEKITRGAGGLLARVIQHEIDHLNGILFIDKAIVIREIPIEDITKENHDEY